MSAPDTFYTAEEIQERQSISTLVFRGYRPLGEGTLAELARHGIKKIELLESPEQYDMADPNSMRFVREACQASGIELGAYHAHMTHFSDLDTEADRLERVDQCRRQVDTMLELGGKVWGSHARDPDAAVVKSYEELARHIEGTDAYVTVENFTRPGLGVEDRVDLIGKIDHPRVGMILDIGHVRDEDGVNPMTLSGGPTRVLEQCGHCLRHVHLHGFKEGVDHFPPLVEGDEIQWVELFQQLHAIDYAGLINFEPSGEPRHTGTLEYTARAPARIVELAASAS